MFLVEYGLVFPLLRYRVKGFFYIQMTRESQGAPTDSFDSLIPFLFQYTHHTLPGSKPVRYFLVQSLPTFFAAWAAQHSSRSGLSRVAKEFFLLSAFL